MPGSIAYERFVWFHEQIKAGRYPNARHLADHFEVSRRTAKRHIEFMKDRLGAPLIYVGERRGYGYDDASFELPLMPITPEEALSVLIARTLLSKTAGGVISDAMRRFGFKLLDQAARFGWAPERLLENSSRNVHAPSQRRVAILYQRRLRHLPGPGTDSRHAPFQSFSRSVDTKTDLAPRTVLSKHRRRRGRTPLSGSRFPRSQNDDSPVRRRR